MAIDLVSTNTTRYHSIPDHSDFTLPDGDWTWITLCYPEAFSSIKYIISTEGFGVANSFNLYTYANGAGIGWAMRIGTLSESPWTGGNTVLATWQWAYATRRSGAYRCGSVVVGGSVAGESAGVGITGSQNAGVPIRIGSRSDGNVDRFWKGRWGQAAFMPGVGITEDQVVQLANGGHLLAMFSSNIKFLAHGRTANDTTFSDIVGGHVLTRQGSSYGTNEEDRQTPYIWTPSSSSRMAATVPPISSGIPVFVNHYRNQGIM